MHGVEHACAKHPVKLHTPVKPHHLHGVVDNFTLAVNKKRVPRLHHRHYREVELRAKSPVKAKLLIAEVTALLQS